MAIVRIVAPRSFAGRKGKGSNEIMVNTAVHLALPAQPDETAPPQFAERSRDVIRYLRFVSHRSRSSARVDLDEACALLMSNPGDAKMRHAEVLMRGLMQAIGKRPSFFSLDTTEFSFDEAWLARLFEAIENQDDDSFVFLIKSRVPVWYQRNVSFLLRSVSQSFLE